MKSAAAALAAPGCMRGAGPVPLFDGKSLAGWKQVEVNAISLTPGGLSDPAGFVRKIATGTDALSVYLRKRLPDPLRASLSAYTPGTDEGKAALSALLKEINGVIGGPSLFPVIGSSQVSLSLEAMNLMRANPQGQVLMRLNKVFLEDWYPEITKTVPTGWRVKDGAMVSRGSGRGVIYTANDFGRFRLMFTMRHVSGDPDHQACVLIFCTRPKETEKPLDALAGIQFQVPNGGHWDYRPGMNNNGGAEFTTVNKPKFDPHEWSRVEILADASQGTARMAVAQPVDSKAVEVLSFRDPAAGKVGPVAWQMHNAGLFDEYKDVTIEVDPAEDRLVSVK